jgi:Gamma-glutamyl cyclotransferase, AIG2-like
MKEYLFSYGTLQQQAVQIKLFGRIMTGTEDILTGYIIQRIEISDPAFLARGENNMQNTLMATLNPSDIIMGTILELTEEELLLADKYEPSNYFRQPVVLASGKTAWVYLAL